MNNESINSLNNNLIIQKIHQLEQIFYNYSDSQNKKEIIRALLEDK
jgi:hypothetical protein